MAGATPEEVIRVVDTFRTTGRSFLIPPEEVELSESSVLDISHESFMRVWKRLKNWVDDEARSAQIYRRLAETAVLHEAGQAGYLQDPELTVGLTWRQVVQPNEVWAERYSPEFEETMAFLDASAGEKELVRRRKNRVLYSFIGSLIMLSGLAIGAAGFAFVQLGRAEEQKVLANERGDELEEQGDDLKEALGKAKEARREADSKRSEAEAAKQEAEEASTEAQERKQEADQAQQAEDEQRQLAETALVRAEEGEVEAQRQADIARDQTLIAEENAAQARIATARAEQATEKAKIQALNSDIQAKALTVENLMASNLNFKALLTALEIVQEINQLERQDFRQTMAAAKAQKKFPVNPVSDADGSDSLILSNIRLQAVSVLREAYYLSGYLEKIP